jgi:hypothetical protein
MERRVEWISGIGQGNLENEEIVASLRRAIEAVAAYYRRFPVLRRVGF